MSNLINPHGGTLKNLFVRTEIAKELKQNSIDFSVIKLSERQKCDIELLLNGGLSPLDSFMCKDEYESVIRNCRLMDGTIWPIPVILDVDEDDAIKIDIGAKISLCDEEGFMIAVLTVQEIWKPDKTIEAKTVYGTKSRKHPGVSYLYDKIKDYYVGGDIQGIQFPTHYEFENLWIYPNELRQMYKKMGWRNIIGFHTTKPMHRMHIEITLQAAKNHAANILIHPAVGMSSPNDPLYYGRVHGYRAALVHYPDNLAILSLLPLAIRLAGPKEALWHAIINQNYGCNYFIIGPNHASPEINDAQGSIFYNKYEAQELVSKYKNELKICPINVPEIAYSPSKKRFISIKNAKHHELETKNISEKKLKELLFKSKDIPEWYSYPNIIDELKKIFPPKCKQGFTLFFTGLSGSGKSTLARILYARLIETGDRPVTLLDGDIVRRNLSSELGFSKKHRNLNIQRIGFVAEEITKNGGIAICAPIAPYAFIRETLRKKIGQHGSFIEIHVSTPIDICEKRDRKGLYAKARKGLILEFTGISDPYDIPENPEIRIDTSDLSPAEAAQQIYLYIIQEGFLGSQEGEDLFTS